MGCHTWFYKRVTIPFEEVKKSVILSLEQRIETGRMIKEREGVFADEDLLEDTPEWTPEHGQWVMDVAKRQIRVINKGYCELAVRKKYIHDGDLTTHYIEGEDYYADAGYHDLFRMHGYPLHQLFSLKETLDYIEKHKCTTYEWTNEKLKAFWDEHPDGMIRFG